MIEICDALRELLEPKGSGVEHDDSGSQPNDYVENTLYAWPNSHRLSLAGTGDVDGGGEWRESFVIRAVYTVPNVGEESSGKRDREVTLALDQKAASWQKKLARAESLPGVWDSIEFTIDHDFVRQLSLRGISVLLTGYRMVAL